MKEFKRSSWLCRWLGHRWLTYRNMRTTSHPFVSVCGRCPAVMASPQWSSIPPPPMSKERKAQLTLAIGQDYGC